MGSVCILGPTTIVQHRTGVRAHTYTVQSERVERKVQSHHVSWATTCRIIELQANKS